MNANTNSHPQEIIVFDFDGTITTKDTFALFLRYYNGFLSWMWRIIILIPTFVAYGVKLIDRNAVKKHVIHRFFKNQPIAKVQSRADSFAREVIPGLIRPGAQKALDSLKNDRESLYICSASITPYLKTWGKSQNIHNILATELEHENGVCTGRISGWNVWGPGKIRRILAEFAPNTVKISHAYGDTRGDKEMLHAAEVSHWRPFRLTADE